MRNDEEGDELGMDRMVEYIDMERQFFDALSSGSNDEEKKRIFC